MSDRARRRFPMLVGALTCLVASACGSAMATPADAYAQGWRRARVKAIVMAQAPVRGVYRDCRTTILGPAGQTTYVLASYAFGGNPNLRHSMVVAVPADHAFAVGDDIRINITRCETAMPLVAGH